MSHLGRLSRTIVFGALRTRHLPLSRLCVVGHRRLLSEKKSSGDERHHGSTNTHNETKPKKHAKKEEKLDEKATGKRAEKFSQPQGWFSRILTGPTANPDAPHQSHSSLLSASNYIYELVTHDAKPGERENYLKIYEEYANEVNKSIPCMNLLGSWRVFYGNRDQAVHLWRYDNGYADVDRAIQAFHNVQSLKAIDHEMGLLLSRRRNVLTKSFSYWGEPKPRSASHIYDLRTYTLKPGTMIEWGAAWSKGITYRRDANQDVGGFFAQVGYLYTVFHIWAYPDLQSRNTTRQQTWAKPGWDQTVAYTVPLIKKMQSKILIPTKLSQLK